MSALNPIYSFIGRSSQVTAMLLAPTFNGLQNVVQAGLALKDDPTAAHIQAYAAGLTRKMAGLPTDQHFVYHAERLYARSDNGLAFIPVWGALFNKCGWACPYFTGYDYLADAFLAALADDSVRGIVFDVDSYGGEAQGCMELADMIYAGRERKPVRAVANANACSAGFAVLSSASRASAIESSYVGSVGVVMMHVDYSGLLEKAGLKVTVLHAGEHKVDGHPYEPLPDAVRKEWQADLNKHRERFAGVVARNRAMSTDAVLATEARVYDGPEALSVGFIDAVESPMAAVIAFANELSGSSSPQELAMTTPQKPGAQATDDKSTTTEPQVDTAKLSAEAAGAERTRMRAILTCDEAKDRTALAEHIAFNTSMSVDEAKAMLAAAPKQAPQGTTNPFETAMAATENPNVGADGGKRDEGEDDVAKQTAALLRAYGAASGRDFKAAV